MPVQQFELREIEYETPTPNTEEKCTKCGGGLHLGTIKPPGEGDGFLAAWVGYTCCECGAVFARVRVY